MIYAECDCVCACVYVCLGEDKRPPSLCKIPVAMVIIALFFEAVLACR